MPTSQPSADGASPNQGGAAATLAQLRGSSSRDLDALFRRARLNAPLPLAGHPRGWVLAVPGADQGILRAIVTAAIRGPFNPWQGKSFRAEGPNGGTGTNRVGFGRHTGAFAFRTYETDSLVDGQRSFAIDYDVADNPGFARSTYDELRPVGSQLWLGRGMSRRAGKAPRVLLWFALDWSRQDAPVAW